MRLPTLHDPNVAPVDAAEVVVMLTTAGLTILFFGRLMIINGNGLAFAFGPTTATLVIGSVCVIAAVVVRTLSPAQADSTTTVRRSSP